MSGNCWLHDHEGVVDAWDLLVLAAIPLGPVVELPALSHP
jgi:hypothetical protein